MTKGNFIKKTIKNRVPVLRWLPRYKAEDALGDLVAGLTVGLTLIPQVLSNLSDADTSTYNRSLPRKNPGIFFIFYL